MSKGTLVTKPLPDIADLINAEYEAGKRSEQDALKHALEIGRLLVEAKASVSHGEWIPWVEANLAFGRKQSVRYMKIWDKRDLLAANVSSTRHLTIDGAVKAITAAKRDAKEAEREKKRHDNASKVSEAKTPDDLEGLFSTIVIDPPWDWGDEGDVNQLGRAKADFAMMSIGDLVKYPIASRAAEDAHIYLWITNRSLPKGFALLEAWGFRYVTMLTWPKPSFGMGNYFRGQTEHVLFGVRGSLMLKRKDAATLLPTWKRGSRAHSSKPVEFLEWVESCSPGPYLEVFSRSKRDGWEWLGEDA